MVIIAHELKYAWDAAMLLAGYFRMWPSEMMLGVNLRKIDRGKRRNFEEPPMNNEVLMP